ncbi:MAG TPA: LytTR family DNA-binding domain-containing protein [Terriglobales bacterium]
MASASQFEALASVSTPVPDGMIRAVIADDEEFARRKLRGFLDRMGNVGVVAECTGGRETIAAVRDLRPELLLIDIQMPDLDGFAVLDAIDLDPPPITVLTTAHDRYAARAFEANALDYLLKPLDEDRLRQTLTKVQIELEKRQARIFAQRMNNTIVETAAPPDLQRESNRLVIKSAGKIVFLDLGEVDWIEAAANYVRFHVGGESYAFRAGIADISGRLNHTKFIRIHRSAIVNVDKIKELQPCNTGEYMAILKNGKELPCSRTYRETLRQFIGKTGI